MGDLVKQPIPLMHGHVCLRSQKKEIFASTKRPFDSPSFYGKEFGFQHPNTCYQEEACVCFFRLFMKEQQTCF